MCLNNNMYYKNCAVVRRYAIVFGLALTHYSEDCVNDNSFN